MAKSSKTKTNKSKIDKDVTDAVEVTDSKIVEGDDKDAVAVDADADRVADDVPDDEDGLDPAAESDVETDLDMENVDDPIEPVTSDMPATVPQFVPEETPSRFMPLVLGGVVAGVIGYGVATFFPLFGNGSEVDARLAEQSSQIAALEDQIANIPTTDLSGVEGQIADLSSQTSGQISDVSDGLSDQLAMLDTRLTDLEKQPNADGTLSDTALAAYQSELEDLRAELNAQQANVMSAAAQAEADLAAARAEAETLEQEAIAAATAAAARAALNRVATAVETGARFASALRDLDATDLPAALTSAAETGVATTAQLTADFPAAARSALATARSEGVSDDAGGIGGFFRNQFDVRSTAPQEGPGPDAVLSRAEAAVKEGRIADALAELEALPEVARAELTDWTARATERADVLNAIATLSETYN